MVNLGFWQLRRLDERQERNAAIDEPRRPAARADRRRARHRRRPRRPATGVPVTAAGRYLPDEQLVVVNRSQHGLAGEIVVTPLQLADGRIAARVAGLRAARPAERAAAPAGDVVVTGRLQPSQQRSTGGLSDPATGDLTEAQRVDIERLAPQLPGEVVPMYVELTASDPAGGGAVPGAAHAARPDRRPAPVLRRAVVHLRRRRRRRLGARRAQVDQDAPGRGTTSSRRRSPRGSRRSSVVIVRLTSRGDASMRRYGAQTSTGRSKNVSKNVANSSWSRRSRTSSP